MPAVLALVLLLLVRRGDGAGKTSKALLRQFCKTGLLDVDDGRGDACVDAAGAVAGCPPGCAVGKKQRCVDGAAGTPCRARARTACVRDGWWLEQSDENARGDACRKPGGGHECPPDCAKDAAMLCADRRGAPCRSRTRPSRGRCEARGGRAERTLFGFRAFGSDPRENGCKNHQNRSSRGRAPFVESSGSVRSREIGSRAQVR